MPAFSTTLDTIDPFFFLKSNFSWIQEPVPCRADHRAPCPSPPGLWSLLHILLCLPANCPGHSRLNPDLTLLFSICSAPKRTDLLSTGHWQLYQHYAHMNFKSVTSHSRLFTCRHFEASSWTCPALNWEFNTSSVKNMFLLQLLNFHWSIT